MREVSISEAGHFVSIPRMQIACVEDIWPDDSKLLSTRPGDYELRLREGVGSGSLMIIRVHNFALVSAQSYAPCVRDGVAGIFQKGVFRQIIPTVGKNEIKEDGAMKLIHSMPYK